MEDGLGKMGILWVNWVQMAVERVKRAQGALRWGGIGVEGGSRQKASFSGMRLLYFWGTRPLLPFRRAAQDRWTTCHTGLKIIRHAMSYNRHTVPYNVQS
jgi:hypothetical protein